MYMYSAVVDLWNQMTFVHREAGTLKTKFT